MKRVPVENQEDPAENADAADLKQGPLSVQPKAQVQLQPVIDPLIVQLLKVWESKTQGIKTLSCDIKRFEFDKVFSTETRSLGRVQYESPDHGRLDFGPADKAWMAKAGRQTADDKAFKIVAGEADTWICTGTHVYVQHFKDKSYNLIDIPPAMQGQNITRSPLPFIFGMKAKEAVEKFAMKLGPMHNPDGTRKAANGAAMSAVVHVIAYPLDASVAREYVQAEVLLDPESFLPLNLRMVDPSGNKETVYYFDHKSMTVNKGFGLLSNPFNKPNVVGWQLMQHIKDQPVAKEPAATGTPTQRAQKPGPVQR